jgi:hypothetical protein
MQLLNETYVMVGWRDGAAILRNGSTGQKIERPLSVDRNDGSPRIQSRERAEDGHRSPLLPVQDLGQPARLPDDS